MEFGGDCSAPTYGKEESLGETSNPEQIVGENSISDDGDVGDVGSGEHVEIQTPLKDNVNETPIETLSEVNEFSPGLRGGSPSAIKGYGLKKWRRIRRDFTKEGGNSVDLSKILKRGPPNASEPSKHRDSSSDIKHTREGSVASVDSVKSSHFPSGLFTRGLSSDSRLAVGYAFPAGTDSEYSEDRSSKSSTAASAPKSKFLSPGGMGSSREKNKAKNANAKSLANLAQKSQLGEGKFETSKKFRGERAKIEKDNSYSSVESDSRSYNVAFAEIASFSSIANGIQRESSVNYDGENSYEAQASDQLSNEEVQTGYRKDSGGEAEYVSQDDEAADASWDVKEEESDNQQPLKGRDPLAESIISLQDVQEALEKELQKLGELGKENVWLADACCKSEVDEASPSGVVETELVKANEKVHLLVRELEEASAKLLLKESRVEELEDILNKSKLSDGGSGSSGLRCLQEECTEMEIELEDLFKQKIEAEVECLAMIQKFKIGSADHIALDQKSLLEERRHVVDKLRDEKSNTDLPKEGSESSEIVKIQNGIGRHACFLIIQFILLCSVFIVFMLTSSWPQSAEVIPPT